MLDPVFEKTEILAPQIGNKSALPIKDTDGHGDEVGVYSDYIAFANLFRPRVSNNGG